MMIRLHVKIRFLFQQAAVIGLICLLHTPGHAQTWLSAVGVGSGTSSEQGRSACTDAAGNVYFIGQFTGTVDFDPGGGSAILTTPSAFADAFITKYNASGQFQWARRCGGAGTDFGAAIATDGTNIFAIGNFVTAGDFGTFNLTAVGGGGTDVWVAKLDANGNWLNAVNFGGANVGDNGQGICTDNSGNVYIVGTYNNSITIGSTTLNVNGGALSDMFAARLTTNLAPVWANGGGAAGDGNTFLGADNGGGAGITYVSALNEIIVVGSYNGNPATYGGITIPNSGGNEIVVLEMNASTGAFLSAVPAGGTASSDDEALGVCTATATSDVFLTGYFNGNITFPGTPQLTNAGQTDFYVARYSPASNNFVWAASGGGSDIERSSNIVSNGSGSVIIAAQFRGSLTFGSTTLTAPGGFSDPLVASFDAANGSKQWAAQGTGNGTFDDFARGITVNNTSGTISITGQFGGSVTFGSTTLTATGASVDIFFARLDPPPPLGATVSSTNPTCDNGCNGTATVTASGGTPPYTYAWSPSGGTAATATGLCAGNYSVTVTDNAGATVVRNVTITFPAVTMSNVTTSNTSFFVRPNNTIIADASCRLIATLVPNSTAPVNGATSARVWIEASVPVYPPIIGLPYVARHYEITPANNTANATGRVTLYFSQAEFNAFNAHPLSIFNLPTGPGDAAGIANLRVAKYPGTSSDNSGNPGSYNQHPVVLDPADPDIVWNATANRWDVSLNVNGFSGFIVQTHPFALPVHWLKFLCVLNGHSRAALSWQVEERMVTDYTIEKSLDGVNYVSIGVVPSKGDGENTYSFTEGQPLQKDAYYRIRQTDIDGRLSYSKIILLKQSKAGAVTAYPNPTKGVVTLNITDASLFNTAARLYDVHGRELQRILISDSVTPVDLGKYGAGMYLLRLQNGVTIKLFRE